MAFELRKTQIGPVLVVQVEGEMVLGPKLRRIASEVTDLEGVRGIVVDLSLCTRLDSAGMGELIMWYGIALKAKQKMLLVGVRESIRLMMRTARVDGILLIAQDREAALKELST